MSFGFGVGDFVAIGTLIVKIVDTLRGAQSEYQELIRELERYAQSFLADPCLSTQYRGLPVCRANLILSLQRALSQVDKLKGRGDQAIAIDQIKCAALTCEYPSKSS